MNQVKKYLGYVWMGFAPVLVVLMCWQAFEKTMAADAAIRFNTALQWGIILLVFIPVCVGFFIFGKYAAEGAYSHLPESSSEIPDSEL
jgi:ABC-type polysaccharide/polyol phosphate export permease